MSPLSKVVPTGTEPEAGAKMIKARLGTSVHIRLWRIVRGGEQWVPYYDPVLCPGGGRFSPYRQQQCGRCRTAQFRVQPVTAGMHRLIFEKRMGWKIYG